MKNLLIVLLFTLIACHKDDDVTGTFIGTAHDVSAGRTYNGSVTLRDGEIDFNFGAFMTKHGVPASVDGSKLTIGRKVFNNSYVIESGTGTVTSGSIQADVIVDRWGTNYHVLINGSK